MEPAIAALAAVVGNGPIGSGMLRVPCLDRPKRTSFRGHLRGALSEAADQLPPPGSHDALRYIALIRARAVVIASSKQNTSKAVTKRPANRPPEPGAGRAVSGRRARSARSSLAVAGEPDIAPSVRNVPSAKIAQPADENGPRSAAS